MFAHWPGDGPEQNDVWSAKRAWGLLEECRETFTSTPVLLTKGKLVLLRLCNGESCPEPCGSSSLTAVITCIICVQALNLIISSHSGGGGYRHHQRSSSIFILLLLLLVIITVITVITSSSFSIVVHQLLVLCVCCRYLSATRGNSQVDACSLSCFF